MDRSYRRSAKSRMSSAQNEFRRERGGRSWEDEFSPSQKRTYGEAMRDLRASYGLTDGLRCNQSEFNDYLARRRAEDKQRRGW